MSKYTHIIKLDDKVLVKKKNLNVVMKPKKKIKHFYCEILKWNSRSIERYFCFPTFNPLLPEFFFFCSFSGHNLR